MYDEVLTQDLSKLTRDQVGTIIRKYCARPSKDSKLVNNRKICICSGNGTQSLTSAASPIFS